MKLVQGPRHELERIAADTIAAAISLLLKKKKQVVLGVPGGRSVSGIFSLLNKKPLEWERIHLFLVDEHAVPIGQENNYTLVRKQFPDKQVHPLLVTSNIEHDRAAYQAELAACGAAFDIILLSAGEDGHVASLFPEHPALQDKENFILIHHAPKPPETRISASLPLLQNAHAAILLFFGQEKQQALENFTNTSISMRFCPAKLVLQIPRTLVITDAALVTHALPS